MDVANEILDAIEIIVDKKIRENTAQIYFGVCKGVSGDSCVMSINGKNNTIHFYGSAPIVGLTYRVFVPSGNMSMAFIITENDDRKGLYYSNPNLLDNWYFANPVNQRGKTEHSGTAATYFIDRWRCGGYNQTIELTQQGLHWSSNTGIWLMQPIENYDDLVGKVVTLSALIDNVLYSATGTVSKTGSIATRTPSDVYLEVTHAEKGVRFVTYSANAPQVSILAVKLELGTQQTLAHQDENGNWILNEIPDYGEQLRRCQRYFVNFNPNKVSYFAMPLGVSSNETTVYSAVALPVAMRAQPVVSYGGNIYVSQQGDVLVTKISISNNTFTGNCIQLRYDTDGGLTANSLYRVQGGNDATSYIWLSADL